MPDAPDATIATPPPVGDAVTPQPPPAGDAAAPPPTPEPARPPERTYTAAEYREVQNEAKNLRARLKEAETAAQAAPAALEAARGEAEALRSQLAAAQEALRSYRLRDAISEATRADDAGDLRGLDAALAARLVEGVEWGEDGGVKGLGPALKKLVKQYPQLVTAPRLPAQPPAGGGGRVPPSAADQQDIIAEKRRLVGAL